MSQQALQVVVAGLLEVAEHGDPTARRAAMDQLVRIAQAPAALAELTRELHGETPRRPSPS